MRHLSIKNTLLFIALFLIAIPILIICGTEIRIAHSQKNNDAPPVVLLHGLGRTRLSLYMLARSLSSKGYAVYLFSYPSRRMGIHDITTLELEPYLSNINSTQQVHFVTHSLGGIVVRDYLATNPDVSVGNIVMMAPPNQGSYLADTWANRRIGAWLLGPAIDELQTNATSYVHHIPTTTTAQIGIISGMRDEKVTTNQTYLPEATDTLFVDAEHTFVMNHQEVINAIDTFLRTGSFQ